MALFLGIKQIVDMLYQFKFLDFGMVGLAAVLIVYKFIKNKSYVGMVKRLLPVDFVVVLLGMVYALAFVRLPSSAAVFAKIASAFMVYVLGRCYGKEVFKHAYAMALVGYFIVYLNATKFFFDLWYVYKYIRDPFSYRADITNGGAFFYYKTDLAFAFIVAAIFIYAFSQVKIMKYITLIVVIPAVTFVSLSRTGQVTLVILYGFWGAYELYKFISRKHAKKEDNEINRAVIKKEKAINIVFIIIAVLFLVAIIALRFSPVKNHLYDDLSIDKNVSDYYEELFHSRHIIWWDILHYMENEPVANRLFGNDLVNLYQHNSRSLHSHCMYLTLIYAVGFVGCFLFIALLNRVFVLFVKNYDKQIKLAYMSMWLIFLIFGITVEALESTQMSWFPFIFLGAVASMIDADKKLTVK